MVFGRSPSPRALRRASTDPSGCPRLTPANCSGLANSGVPTNAPGDEIPASEADSSSDLRQAEVDDFGRYAAFLLQPHHDVCWLDISVDKVLFVNCGQSGSNLRCNFKRQLHVKPTGAFDKILERFPLYKLHRVEVVLTGSAQVEDRGNIRVTNARRRARFA